MAKFPTGEVKIKRIAKNLTNPNFYGNMSIIKKASFASPAVLQNAGFSS